MNQLGALLKRLESAGLPVRRQGRPSDIPIDHLASDSRAVGPGGLFVAIRGGEADGHLFIDKAVQNGAIAIVCEAVPKDARERYPRHRLRTGGEYPRRPRRTGRRVLW